jgi:glyoxylase I family protein
MASPPPFRLEGLDHVVLLVSGMNAARDFYRDVVGCTVDRELPEYGLLQLRAGRSLIDLVDTASEEGAWVLPPVEGGRNMDHVCIVATGYDPDAVRSHLQSYGVEIVEEGIRYGASGNGYSIYFNDPFGNQIELKDANGA